MSTTIEKLQKIIDTKKALQTSINNKGGAITDDTPFNEYPLAVDGLSTGGGETTDRMQEKINGSNSCEYLMTGYKGDSVDFLEDLNISNVTNMSYMFRSCSNISSIPTLNTSKVTNMKGMFNGCASLLSIPELDTSNVTDMVSMFQAASSLQSIPLLNTSKVTEMGSMFYNCRSLQSIPLLNTNKVTSMGSMFYNCSSLQSIPALDASNVTSISNIFKGCTSLKSILMYGMKWGFDISASTQFEREDLVTILNNLAIPTTQRTLTMGSTNLAKLTDEDKAIATNKNWTLA